MSKQSNPEDYCPRKGCVRWTGGPYCAKHNLAAIIQKEKTPMTPKELQEERLYLAWVFARAALLEQEDALGAAQGAR